MMRSTSRLSAFSHGSIHSPRSSSPSSSSCPSMLMASVGGSVARATSMRCPACLLEGMAAAAVDGADGLRLEEDGAACPAGGQRKAAVGPAAKAPTTTTRRYRRSGCWGVDRAMAVVYTPCVVCVGSGRVVRTVQTALQLHMFTLTHTPWDLCRLLW